MSGVPPFSSCGALYAPGARFRIGVISCSTPIAAPRAQLRAWAQGRGRGRARLRNDCSSWPLPAADIRVRCPWRLLSGTIDAREGMCSSVKSQCNYGNQPQEKAGTCQGIQTSAHIIASPLPRTATGTALVSTIGGRTAYEVSSSDSSGSSLCATSSLVSWRHTSMRVSSSMSSTTCSTCLTSKLMVLTKVAQYM